MTTTNKVILSYEIRGPEVNPDEMKEVRKTIRDIGYEQDGFHHEKLDFFNYLHSQSTDIVQVLTLRVMKKMKVQVTKE